MPNCHLPIPGKKFSNRPVSVPCSSLCLRSNHPTCVFREYCESGHLHHCSVPTSSSDPPLGKGGCTRAVFTPRYSNHFVDNGNAGTYGMALKDAWKSGVDDSDASRWSPLASKGNTLTCLASPGRFVHSKRARCLGMFQSGLVSQVDPCATKGMEEAAGSLYLPLNRVCFCETYVRVTLGFFLSTHLLLAASGTRYVYAPGMMTSSS